jgi:hypothetical protein
MTAGVRKSGVAKGATLTLSRLMICGVPLMSPDEKSHDEMMEQVIDAFPTDLRRAISSVVCCQSCIYVELRPCTEEAAFGIGRAFEQACEGCEVIMNGLGLAEIAGALGTPWSR